MSGSVGRTEEGQILDEYIAEIRDKRLRRRVHRTLAHIDREFLQNDEWENGAAYEWWPKEIKRKFYKRGHELLRELMIDYVRSIFCYDYKPTTRTQLSLQRKQAYEEQREKENAEVEAFCQVVAFLAFMSIPITAFITTILYFAARP
jgi:hypothetical protein